ncbi:hypothetical protein LTR50_002834 [Elasticomyces elasticus]|nr:hypothetical protein LTR50_002834 [Elasticomyces elasticus]
MPCRRVAAQLVPTNTTPLWITDDILTQAFHRFADVSNTVRKRHGSNVPGPLEALRRLTKRRLMALSNASAAPPPDYGQLFGSSKPSDPTWKWESPTKMPSPLARSNICPTSAKSNQVGGHDQETQELLATQNSVSRLKRNSLVTRQPLKELKESLSSRRQDNSHASIMRQRKRTWTSELRLCQDLEQIRRCYFALSSSALYSPSFSRAAFKRLLDLVSFNSPAKEMVPSAAFQCVVDFLQDQLNDPNAGNTLLFVGWLKDRKLSPASYEKLTTVIYDKISLGTIPEIELQDVLKELCGVHRVQTSDKQQEDVALTSMYRRLWTAIQSRTLTIAQKADSKTPYTLLGLLAARSRSAHVVQLALNVHASLLPSANTHGNVAIGNFFSEWVRRLGVAATEQGAHTMEHEIALLQDALDRLPANRVEEVVCAATEEFVHHSVLDDSIRSERKASLEIWLRCISQCKHTCLANWNGSLWQSVYRPLALCLKPTDLAVHFASLPAHETARILLHHWVYRALQQPGTSTDRSWHIVRQAQSELAVTYTVRRDYRPAKSGYAQDPERVFGDIEAFLERRMAAYCQKHSPQIAPFVDLIAAVACYEKHYEHLTMEITQLMMMFHSPRRLFTFFMRLSRANGVYVTHRVAIELINFFISTNETGYALRVFERQPHVWLSHCPDLPLALIEQTPIAGEDIFALLNRPEYMNRLDPTLRAQDPNPLSHQRVNLVHLIAYKFANSPHIRSRVALRRVYECYRYLHDRRAPMFSLLSRAFVRAGVIRPLEEGRWVSTIWFRWALRFVRDLEGESVADDLDKLVYVWRGRVLEEQRQKALLAHWRATTDDVVQQTRQNITFENRSQRKADTKTSRTKRSVHVETDPDRRLASKPDDGMEAWFATEHQLLQPVPLSASFTTSAEGVQHNAKSEACCADAQPGQVSQITASIPPPSKADPNGTIAVGGETDIGLEQDAKGASCESTITVEDFGMLHRHSKNSSTGREVSDLLPATWETPGDDEIKINTSDTSSSPHVGTPAVVTCDAEHSTLNTALESSSVGDPSEEDGSNVYWSPEPIERPEVTSNIVPQTEAVPNQDYAKGVVPAAEDEATLGVVPGNPPIRFWSPRASASRSTLVAMRTSLVEGRYTIKPIKNASSVSDTPRPHTHVASRDNPRVGRLMYKMVNAMILQRDR